jgi:hypothetical protein
VKRPTLTIAGLMVSIVFVGVALKALREPSWFMASAVFSFAVCVLSAAVLLACVKRGRSRAGWIGMSAFGLTYLHFGFVGGDPGYPPFVTTALLTAAADRMPGAPPPTLSISLGRTFGTSKTSFLSRAVDNGFNRYAFGQVGHSIASILFGLVGAIAGRVIADQDDSRPS